MTVFAFCHRYGDTSIYQFDSASPSSLPFAVRQGLGNVTSIAFTAAKEFLFVDQTSKIFKTGPDGLSLVYAHDAPIVRVRVRNVTGTERIYFSVLRQGATFCDIYFLQAYPGGPHALIPTLYMTVEATQLTFPDGCHPDDPSLPEWWGYTGDFDFDGDDTLYLSTGGIQAPKVGVYKIDQAGPDSVSGTISRIYLGEGPITSLCYRVPQTLYFLRVNDVCKLDLATLSETLEGTITLVPPNAWLCDIAEIGEGFPVPIFWPGKSFVYKALQKLAVGIIGYENPTTRHR